MAESKRIYRNKKTGQTIITGEQLDKRQWEFVREIKTGQITKIRTA